MEWQRSQNVSHQTAQSQSKFSPEQWLGPTLSVVQPANDALLGSVTQLSQPANGGQQKADVYVENDDCRVSTGALPFNNKGQLDRD